MKHSSRIAFRASRALFEAWWDAGSAFTTIALRTPIVIADPRGREAKLMVAEKIEAAREAAFAAGRELSRMSLSPPTTSAAVARNVLRLVEVASKPQRRKVRANARRLSGLGRVDHSGGSPGSAGVIASARARSSATKAR